MDKLEAGTTKTQPDSEQPASRATCGFAPYYKRMGVKASGGIRDAETAIAMVKAGASRLGVSASVAIVNGQAGSGNY